MMNEEDMLLKKFGNENHFTVPEGYFDNMTSHILAQLPDGELSAAQTQNLELVAEFGHKAKMGMLRPMWKYAVAACLVGGVLVGSIALVHRSESSRAHMMAETSAVATHAEDSNFDEAADYVMLDNQDIYASLLAENYNK